MRSELIEVYLKREDLQQVRSYKIRGAYNKISSLSKEELAKGVICASAGNHAQGVAYSCNLLQIHGVIYMPKTTPKQKIKQVQLFGKSFVDIVLTGDTFDDAYASAIDNANKNNKKLYQEENNCINICYAFGLFYAITNDQINICDQPHLNPSILLN